MRKINFKLDFKRDMTDIEIMGIEKIIDNYSYNTEDMHIPSSENLGLAYTSSSAHAMYNVTELVYVADEEGENEMELQYFGITENNMLVMALTDEDENYIYYEIEPSDFY